MSASQKNLDLIFQEIDESDFLVLAPVMKRAFDDNAQKHLGKESGGPPGYEYGKAIN